jgi:hypothetical protein
MNVRATIAYAGRCIARPRYHANDFRRDVLDIAPVEMDIVDARGREMTLDGTTLPTERPWRRSTVRRSSN